MKKLLSVCLIAAMVLLIGGCAKKETATDIRLGGLKGPTTMGMVKLLSDAEANNTKNGYDFTLAGTGDELTPKVLQGELDIVSVPMNLGAVLYQRTEGGVQLIAVNTLGVLYMVEKGGNSVTDLQSLRGKTIYATGKGTIPEWTLRYLFTQNGMDLDKDVTVVWKTEPTEIVAQMATETESIAMLPQPYVTVAQSKVAGLRVALDLTEEWQKVGNGSQLMTSGLFVRKAFAEEHPEAVRQFLKEYEASAQYANDHVAETAALIEKYDIAKAAVAEKALPECNIVCITGEAMKQAAEGYIGVLYAQNAKAVGGALPAEDFYNLMQ